MHFATIKIPFATAKLIIELKDNGVNAYIRTIIMLLLLSIKVLMSIWILVKRIVVATEWIFASKRW